MVRNTKVMQEIQLHLTKEHPESALTTVNTTQQVQLQRTRRPRAIAQTSSTSVSSNALAPRLSSAQLGSLPSSTTPAADLWRTTQTPLHHFSNCLSSCKCTCHKITGGCRTLQSRSYVFGTIALNILHVSSLSKRCDVFECLGQGKLIKVDYYLPLWLFPRMVSMAIKWSLDSAGLLLRTPRCRPCYAVIIQAVKDGDINKTRLLLAQGEASVYDTMEDWGISPLTVCQNNHSLIFWHVLNMI